MMEELATVISVDQTNVTLQSQVKSSCSSCQQIENCGSGQVSKAFPQRKLIFTLTTPLSVKVGDLVMLGIPESDMLKVAWQVYLWPILGLILFSAMGQWFVLKSIFSAEWLAILLGFFGGYAGFRLARFWQKVTNNDLSIQPKVLRVLPEKISVTQITS